MDSQRSGGDEKRTIFGERRHAEYVSRLEVKDDAQKQALEELIEIWKKNREELYDGIKNLI